mmetsp:Transcript_8951/g.10361  ORF Transcript_8951/g.10361 Transcript_8951/m.10361 type:complete len:146 (+) Transcript_8951:8-445(+)
MTSREKTVAINVRFASPSHQTLTIAQNPLLTMVYTRASQFVFLLSVLLFSSFLLRAQSETPDSANNHFKTVHSSHRSLLDRSKNQLSQGPWPECVGMQGDDCVAHIEKYAPDTYTTIVYPKEVVTERVWVYTDEQDIVNKVPARG